MKRKLTFGIIFLFCYYTQAQIQDLKLSKLSELTNLPETFKQILKSPQAEFFQIAKLNTKNDSINSYITKYVKGEMTQFLYWMFNKSENSNVSILKLEKNESDKKYIKINTNLRVDEHRPSVIIPLTINYTEETNTLKYSWLDKFNNNTNKANLVKLENIIDYGSSFPVLDLKESLENHIDLEKYENKILVINIWAISCSPCRKEIPELNKLRNKYIDNKEIEFIAISSEKPKRIEKFLSNHTFNYTQAYLPSKEIDKLTKSYPLHMIVNKNNIIEFYFSGYSEESSKLIEKAINNQLKK